MAYMGERQYMRDPSAGPTQPLGSTERSLGGFQNQPQPLGPNFQPLGPNLQPLGPSSGNLAGRMMSLGGGNVNRGLSAGTLGGGGGGGLAASISGGYGGGVSGSYGGFVAPLPMPPQDVEAPYRQDPDGLAPRTEEAARLLRLSSARVGGMDRGLSQPLYGGGGGSLSRGLSLGSTGGMSNYRPLNIGAGNYQPPPREPSPVEHDDEFDDEFVPLPPMPNEALPIVPPERLLGQQKRLDWEIHPSAPFILALLNRRGVIPELHRPIVEYHMAEAFLDCMYALMRGSYFVRYALKNASPKERYFNIQLLPDNNERPAPFLCWYIHRTAVQMIDKVPLDDLVGVTPNCKSHSFRRWLVSHDVIKGCMHGHHKNRMSTRGCFTLWFYDKVGQRPRSVDLLTNNMSTFTLWIKCLQGILSVNSTTVNGMTDAAQEMQKLMKLAQQAHLQDPYDDGEGLMGAQLADG